MTEMHCFSRQKKLVLLMALVLFMAGCPKEKPIYRSTPTPKRTPHPTPQDTSPLVWKTWGPQVFAKAKKANKPLCLYLYNPQSFWCQKFTKTYLENSELRPLFNSFSLVKARGSLFPELKAVYGRRGLPALVFLSNQGEFFALFYGFQTRAKLTGFLGKIRQVVLDKTKFKQRLQRLKLLKKKSKKLLFSVYLAPSDIKESLLEDHLELLRKTFDPYFGGFGKGLKIYHFPTCRLLLLSYLVGKTPQYLQMVEKTLNQIERSPLYDRLGGGFHRLSSSRSWDNPFFEKTLESNGDFLRSYALLDLLQGKGKYRKIGGETGRFLMEKLKSPKGYFSGLRCGLTWDDFGRSYTWSKKELQKLLPPPVAKVIELRFGLDWDQKPKNIVLPLGIYRAPSEIGQLLQMPPAQVKKRLQKGLKILKQARSRRKSPPVIPVITLSSQATTALAFFTAYRAWEDPKYLREGLRLIEKLALLQEPSGALPFDHRYLLQDQIDSALAFLEARRLTGKDKYFQRAQRIITILFEKAKSSNPHGGFRFGWGQKGPAGKALQMVDFYENSKMAYLCMVFYGISGSEKYRTEALKIFRLLGNIHTNFGQFGSFFNLALLLYLRGPIQIFLIQKKIYPQKLLLWAGKTPFFRVVRFQSPRQLARRFSRHYKPENIGYVVYNKKVFPLQKGEDLLRLWKKIPRH